MRSTNSCCEGVGVWKAGDNRVKIIKNEEGNKTTPSVVCCSGMLSPNYVLAFYGIPNIASDQLVVGDLAFKTLDKDPHNCIRCVKRLMGRR